MEKLQQALTEIFKFLVERLPRRNVAIVVSALLSSLLAGVLLFSDLQVPGLQLIQAVRPVLGVAFILVTLLSLFALATGRQPSERFTDIGYAAIGLICVFLLGVVAWCVVRPVLTTPAGVQAGDIEAPRK